MKKLLKLAAPAFVLLAISSNTLAIETLSLIHIYLDEAISWAETHPAMASDLDTLTQQLP